MNNRTPEAAQLWHQIETFLPVPLQETTEVAANDLIAALPEPRRATIYRQGPALIKTLAYSPWLQQTFLRDPEKLAGWLEQGCFEKKLDLSSLQNELTQAAEACQDRAELKVCLHRIHQREQVSIAWRDLNGLADLQENLLHISMLAQSIVAAAVTWLSRELTEKHGAAIDEYSGNATELTLLAMGKLGGGELNFYSDIDLIPVYTEAGQTDGKKGLSNEEFFTRLVRALVDLLQNPSGGGQLYIVDLRLRPFGDSGPLVVTSDALEAYYSRHGREWERYALIKARPVAGSIELGEQLLQTLSPFVYRRYLDYGAFQSLRELKHEIDQQIERQSRQYSVKLGRGGIREIEFIVQAFQLVHGGRDQRLRDPQLATVLALLQERGDLTAEECQMLTQSYEFLRRSEHRIQMLHRVQTHLLPEDELDLLRLATAMGYPDTNSYLAALESITTQVSALFAGLLTYDDQPTDANPSVAEVLWNASLEQDQALATLESFGFAEPLEAHQSLLALHKSRNYLAASELAHQRLQQLIPKLLSACASQQSAQVALKGTLRLLESILRRSAYLSLLYENPSALIQLCQLCAAGEWITDWLCQHPVLLDDLLDERAYGQRPDRQQLAIQFRRAIDQAEGDLEQQMNRLRDVRNGAVLHAAMLDISAIADSGPLLTDIAELVLDNCLQLAWQQLIDSHGHPPGYATSDPLATDMLVIGYGKLGAAQLSYQSDLDLVVLQPTADGELLTDGAQPAPLHRFYHRICQRFIHLLSTQTTSGRLYEVDLRLRPNGNAGPVVSDLESFHRYQLNGARTWEHQALVHARPVAGDQLLGNRFAELRIEILRLPRQAVELAGQIDDMRQHIAAEKAIDTLADQLKLGAGGMLDIEFFSQYLVLLHAADHSELTVPTTVVGILAAGAAAGVISAEDKILLTSAYQKLGHNRRRWELSQPVDAQVSDAAWLDQTRQRIQGLMGTKPK